MHSQYKTPRQTFKDRVRKRISRLLPCREWAASYNQHKFIYDCLAGLTCALIIVPQSLSYAKLAHVPLERGLYAAMVCAAPYALFGTSQDMALGPTAILSLIVASITDGCEGDQCVQWSVGSAFIAGFIQLVLGLINAGAVSTLISHSVISGFCSGASLIVMVSQLPQWFAVKARRPFFQCLYDIFSQLSKTRYADLALGVSVCLVLLLLRPVAQKVKSPGLKVLLSCRNVIVILFCITMSFVWHSVNKPAHNAIKPNYSPFTTVGPIPSGLPLPHFPDFDFGSEWGKMLRGGLILAIIGFMETYSIGCAYSAVHRKRYSEATAKLSEQNHQSDANDSDESNVSINQQPSSSSSTSVIPKLEEPRRVSPNQELVAVGSGNLLSALFGGFAITGSFARSAVAHACGVQTPFSNLWGVLVCMLSLLFATPFLKHTPTACLASVIIVGVMGLIDVTPITQGYDMGISALGDVVVVAGTFVSVLVFGVEEGLLIGIIVHLLITVAKQARPTITVTAVEPPRSLLPSIDGSIEGVEVQARGPVLVVEILGPLHYISAPRIMAKLRKVHAHYSSDHALVGSSTGTSHNMTTAPILSDYSASTANFDDDDDVEGINYETAETSNTLLLSSLSSASLTGVAPPAVTDTNTVPLCAVVIDLSKACQWDVAGLHVVESLCEFFTLSPPTATPSLVSLHLLVNPSTLQLLQSCDYLNKFAWGVSLVAPTKLTSSSSSSSSDDVVSAHPKVHAALLDVLTCVQQETSVLHRLLHGKKPPASIRSSSSSSSSSSEGDHYKPLLDDDIVLAVDEFDYTTAALSQIQRRQPLFASYEQASQWVQQ